MNSVEPDSPHHQNNAVNAYSSSSGSINRKLLFIGLGLFLFLILRNAFIRDYDNETRNYLTSVGKTELIDTIIPKTPTELKLEKLGKDELLKQLAQNMTIAMQTISEMKLEIEKLKSINNSSKT